MMYSQRQMKVLGNDFSSLNQENNWSANELYILHNIFWGLHVHSPEEKGEMDTLK